MSENNTHTESANDWFWGALEQFLDKKALKQTNQRRVIAEFMLKLDRHIDAEELFNEMRSQGHNIGFATIYRTLNLFKDAGLVEQKTFEDGKAIFELQRPDEHHDHLICNDCGKVFEFENEEIEALQKKVAESFGLKLTSHNLDLRGICIKSKCEFRDS